MFRSEAQLTVIMKLLQIDFPELINVEKEQTVDEAGETLFNELSLYLNCNDISQLQRAKIKTDLLIP